jgi:shikimate dehydrogenase
MLINENTKVMLRLHTEANTRGLQIYNPYFEKVGLNAVYLLTHNKDFNKLIQGIKNLNFAGAISAGFEKDHKFAESLDELTDEAQFTGRVGILVNRNGKLIGHYQGGQGLYASIVAQYGELKDKKMVLLGAGTVAKALLYEMRKKDDIADVTVINRTLKNAEILANEFSFVNNVSPLNELENQQANVFVDTTDIGSPWNSGDDYLFTEKFVKRFDFVADVTFVPTEPQLIKVAKEAGVNYSPGYKMFMHQANICTEMILGHKLEFDIYEKLMLEDFSVNWS